MDDIDAERLRPLFEQFAGSVHPVKSDAYLEVVRDAADELCIKANAAGFIYAGIKLMRQGLNATGLPSDQPLKIELRNFTIDKDKSGRVIFD